MPTSQARGCLSLSVDRNCSYATQCELTTALGNLLYMLSQFINSFCFAYYRNLKMEVTGNRGGLVQRTERCGAYRERVEHLSADPLQYAQYHHPYADQDIMIE